MLTVTWSLAYIMCKQKMTTKKNAGKLLAILIAMQIGGEMQGTSPNGAHPGLHSKPLDATIGQVFALHRPGGRHGQRI